MSAYIDDNVKIDESLSAFINATAAAIKYWTI